MDMSSSLGRAEVLRVVETVAQEKGISTDEVLEGVDLTGRRVLITGAASGRSGSKSFTSPAMRAAKLLASKRVIGPMPLLPASRARHTVSISCPSGVIQPIPVRVSACGSPARSRAPDRMSPR